MNLNNGMCESLITWLQSIVPNRTKNVEEIYDGVAILEALMQIAPEHFNKLEPKIKRDVSSSWRLCVSNLKKVLEAVTEYYQDVLTLHLLEEGRPDVTEIGANHDTVHLCKLLRLILGCAINCERKQEYITKIMEMEESVQQNIKQAIEQLDLVTGGRSGISLLIVDNERVSQLVGELEVANRVKENLNQQCQQMEVQLQNVLEENQTLAAENQALKDKENKNADLRKQNEDLKEELFKTEVMRDDFKAKITEQQKQIKLNQEKIAELQLAANDTARLKDEIDALSESAAKVQVLEANLASYKKKLEKYADAKKTLQKLEEKNMEYLQKILKHEEELAKVSSWKSQCETYKRQLVEMEQKLDEETQRADKAQFNCEKLETNLVASQGEKERIVHERDVLREEIEELKMTRQPKRDSGAAMAQELTPTEMKERLRFLDKENKTLRSTIQEHETNQALLESTLGRIDKLQQQKRSANQTILKLEAQIEELRNKFPPDDSPHGEGIVKEYKQKVVTLQEALSAKECELQTAQAKYTRSLEKAREVAQHLEMKSNGGLDASVHHLGHMKEMEEKLITTAFYKLGMTCQREAIDERFVVLSGGQGQSFLARQRQPTPRKQIQRFKSK